LVLYSSKLFNAVRETAKRCSMIVYRNALTAFLLYRNTLTAFLLYRNTLTAFLLPATQRPACR